MLYICPDTKPLNNSDTEKQTKTQCISFLIFRLLSVFSSWFFTLSSPVRWSFLVYLFDGGSGLQSVATCHRLFRQVAPLLLQGPDPLLDGSLVELILFGQQVLTSTQNPLVQRLLGLKLRLQHLTGWTQIIKR